MRTHYVSSLVLTALLASAAGCMGAPSNPQCDEPDNSCGRPFLRSTTPISALRDPDMGRRMLLRGRPVDARNLQVTAYDELDETMNGDLGTVYVQETIAPGDTADPFLPCPLLSDRSARVCGISTFNTQFSPLAYRPKIGDLVDMSGGQYDEFDCSRVCGSPPQPFPDGRFLPQVRSPTIRSAGVAPLATPVRVTVEDIAMHNAALIGVLVEVLDVTAVGEPDCRGEIALTAGASGVRITQEMVRIPHGEARVDPRGTRVCPTAPPPRVPPDPDRVRSGTRWSRIVGVVSYFYGSKLVPRTVADLTAAP